MRFKTPKIAFTSLCIGAALVTSISVAQAASLSVAINQSRIISLSEPASTFVVGNPSIADANFASPTQVLILGKTYGATNLIALDASGKVILNTNLHVVTNQSNRVSLYKGSSKQSLDCYGDCVAMIDLGDDLGIVEPLIKTTGAAQDLAGKSANDDN
ncbi:MAG: pilus assembly protein N-terminal domain-containing protein [Parvibaculaceae bacterium]|nr:pilus assembly protein N-terminal domain-containing protein [Parvibaculaceae bacterium]